MVLGAAGTGSGVGSGLTTGAATGTGAGVTYIRRAGASRATAAMATAAGAVTGATTVAPHADRARVTATVAVAAATWRTVVPTVLLSDSGKWCRGVRVGMGRPSWVGRGESRPARCGARFLRRANRPADRLGGDLRNGRPKGVVTDRVQGVIRPAPTARPGLTSPVRGLPVTRQRRGDEPLRLEDVAQDLGGATAHRTTRHTGPQGSVTQNIAGLPFLRHDGPRLGTSSITGTDVGKGLV